MIDRHIIEITTVDDDCLCHYDTTIFIDTEWNVNTTQWIAKQVDNFVRTLPSSEKLFSVEIKEKPDIISIFDWKINGGYKTAVIFLYINILK